MANLIERAIACDDGDRAARMIQEALGIESDDVANYVFPKSWPTDREQRPHYRSGRVDHWLKIKNPAAPAVKRAAEEDWGNKRWARWRRL